MQKRVGDITEDLLLFGAVGIGLYFLFTKLLPNFGQGVNENNAGSAAATTTAAAADTAAAAAAGSKQTLSNSSIAAMASTINNDLQITDFSGNPNPNLMDAVTQVAQCNTAADWFALITAFGNKNFNTGGALSLCSWTASECTSMGLVAALQAAISWDVAQGNTTDAATQVQNLNGTMNSMGVAQSFTLS
jgi:uncharacterized protein (UPF0333 family)